MIISIANPVSVALARRRLLCRRFTIPPRVVTADEREVHVDGPGGAISSMTPDAAAETFNRLLDGAAETQRQLALARVRAQEEKDRRQ